MRGRTPAPVADSRLRRFCSFILPGVALLYPSAMQHRRESRALAQKHPDGSASCVAPRKSLAALLVCIDPGRPRRH
ncbi:MAG TPA: hypothetical protein VF666_03200 [Pyrinomonadaceae bacterium]